MKSTYLTKKGLLRIKSQIATLLDDIRECNRRIGYTVSLDNDLRENPEFMALRTKAEYEIPNKLAELNKILNNHIIIESMTHIIEKHYDIVNLGHKVTLEDDNQNIKVIHILGYDESDPLNNIVSYLTPMAQLLLEQGIDDIVEIPISGNLAEFHVKQIEVSDFLSGVQK